MTKLSLQTDDNGAVIRALEAQGIEFISAELYKGEEDGHRFKVGERAKLIGLEGYPKFNGEIITISAIREDGEHGKAYYFTTDNDDLALVLNWMYEYRLEKISSEDYRDSESYLENWVQDENS